MTNKPLLVIFLSIGLMWLRSSYSKFTSGNFASSLGGTLSKTVDKNPFPFFKQFLVNVAIPNSQIFGFMTQWGELLSALAIAVGALWLLIGVGSNKLAGVILLAGLVGGAFLNIIFWLGFGYTSISTDSLNLLMAIVQIVGIVVLLKQF